jgi:hypothetical protein
MAEQSWTWATWLPIAISSLALIISLGTALATWWAPQEAARLAEGLRTASARADLKRSVFLTLMQQRALPFTEEAVQAFNAIDVVFVDAPTVREKWQLYLKSKDLREQVPPAMQQQRLTELLAAMAADVGLTGISAADLERSYAPDYLRRRIRVGEMADKAQEQELQRALAQASANTTPQASS